MKLRLFKCSIHKVRTEAACSRCQEMLGLDSERLKVIKSMEEKLSTLPEGSEARNAVNRAIETIATGIYPKKKGGFLTVQELKEKLNKFPDYYKVILDGHDDFCEAEDVVSHGTEEICITRGGDISASKMMGG